MTTTAHSELPLGALPPAGEVDNCLEFEQIAKGGFGDAYNGISHSMAYFDGQLFVGTSRCNLHMISVNSNAPPNWVSPVRCPENVYELDRRAQMWSLDTARGDWTQVYVSPARQDDDGTMIPRDIGYRCQTVFQGASDPSRALYATTWSPSRGQAPQLLRSLDGRAFERVGMLGSGQRQYNTFRTLVEFRDRLYTSPTGMTKGYGLATECMVDAAVVYETHDPVNGKWVPASEPGFGDQTNMTVFELKEFAGNLYAGTLNPVTGFQVWKTRGTGRPPYEWVKVLDRGAARGNLNEIAVSMCVFHDALYVGTGIQHGGRDRVHKIGPCGAELIRINPDDSWDLIVGDTRMTPGGRKLPLSGKGPGFGSLLNAIFWAMAVHDDHLYLGTYNWAVFLPYLNQINWPATFRQQINDIGIDNIVDARGGFDIWRTQNGVEWSPVTTDGFGNPFNYGVRNMLETPHGLYVGTANTFGPEVAVSTRQGWVYVENPDSGTEVWLRRSASPVEHTRASMPESKTVANVRQRYDSQMYDPLIEEYYGGSGFYNWGYWEPGVESQEAASRNLVERLLARIPEKTGSILDVACGKGAVAGHLLRHYQPSEIVGVDISPKLMRTARKLAPGCRFLMADATQLPFDDSSFGTVLCVDGAALFNTRAKFVDDAFRVLKPGGRLVLSDRLLTSGAVQRLGDYHVDNFVDNLDEYCRMFESAGFYDIELEDATDFCRRGYILHFAEFARGKLSAGEIDVDRFNAVTHFLFSRITIVREYVLVSASKPVMKSSE